MPKTRIQQLYELIPQSVCRSGCCDCCHDCVQWAPEELKRAGGFRYENGHCSHLSDDGKCGAYENRPLVCRLYGTSELMPCDSCTPQRYLSADETRKIIDEYLAIKKSQE